MSTDVTQLLANWSQRDNQALERLTPLVYEELRQLASYYLRRERPGHTLQSTALVHEAYLKLVGQREVQWKNQAHFFGVAAQMIRRILVDHARARQAEKRGSNMPNLSLDEALGVPGKNGWELVALDDALNALAAMDPQQARVIELRFFAGLSIEETAAVLDVSLSTVKRDWATAKAWLFRELSRRSGSDA